MMLADAIHCRKFDNDGIEYNDTDNEPPQAEPTIEPKTDAADIKPDPDTAHVNTEPDPHHICEELHVLQLKKEGDVDEDCQEIIDLKTPGVVHEGEDPDEVMRGLLESGFAVLHRARAVDVEDSSVEVTATNEHQEV
ncbi:hypothetical protein R1sor_010757 [Riccia sorocarpa]|uniref:Uncharacterized protein n=1 Tax=Riccia sorocarpa TaxID=122646 RepID=A0ABD3I0B9_9MARC